ncbi:MAG: hypothetical protein Q4G27_02880 [Flavobacteriaceae bacterium]|nr:hypothetical protein [Flavobacteriaceae bacterium]
MKELIVKGKKKKSTSTTEYIGWANDGVAGWGEGLWETRNRGGSFRLFKNQAKGYEWAPKYYPDNRFGSGKASKHPVYNVSKTLKNGTMVTSVLLEVPDIAEAVIEDKGIGKNAKKHQQELLALF